MPAGVDIFLRGLPGDQAAVLHRAFKGGCGQPPASTKAFCSVCNSLDDMQNVKRAFADGQHIDASVVKKLLEAIAQVIVHDGAVGAAHLVLGGVAVIHVVRRIRENHVGQRAVQHPFDVRQHGAVAAKQKVVAQPPKVARFADRRFRRFRHGVFVGLTFGHVRFGQQGRQFVVGKTDDGHIEILRSQGCHFGAQQIVVPSGIKCQLVVGDDVGALLRVGQMIQHDDRDLREAELFCRLEATMPCNDARRVSTRIGLRKPNSAMLAAIWLTCSVEWVRGFLS
jgi:hypothetical protein